MGRAYAVGYLVAGIGFLFLSVIRGTSLGAWEDPALYASLALLIVGWSVVLFVSSRQRRDRQQRHTARLQQTATSTTLSSAYGRLDATTVLMRGLSLVVIVSLAAAFFVERRLVLFLIASVASLAALMISLNKRRQLP